MFRSLFNSTVIRILKDVQGKKQAVGAGFIASNKQIVTCAHVVADALGVSRESQARPVESVWVDLPLSENSKLLRATPRIWHPVRDEIKRGELEDIAVLELCAGEAYPPGTLPAPIVVLDDHAFFDRAVKMCGFPAGMDSGDWLDGRLQGPVSTGWIQLDPALGGRAVAPGFSGTPVWDKREKAVTGIIVSTQTRDGVPSAYMIPVSLLIKAWPEFDVQCRPPNPYRGLQAFQAQDAANFFGREREIEELLEAVRGNALVSVVGPSGSGKSSLVFAGVEARLQEDSEWLVARFRPTREPFEELATALAPLVYPTSDPLQRREARNRVADKLTSRALNITDLVAVILQKNPDRRLLIIADQFEELYTQDPGTEQRIQFLEGLLGMVKGQGRSPACCLLLTIRADFFSQLLSYGPLAEAIDRFPKKILGPLSEEGLHRAITGPAKRLGVASESGLSERILQDLNRESGTLPLLEFALMLLWERQTQRKLTHAAYEAIGGVEQALADYADGVYESFREQGPALRRIFVQLVRPGEGTEDTRQVATREQVGADNWHLVTKLADARLLVTNEIRIREKKTQTVELVHEALIRHWRPLREWIEAEREFRVWQNRLRQALSAWQEQKDDDLLLRGTPLAKAQEWLEDYSDALTADEREFIEAGIELRRRKEVRAKRVRWGIAAGLLVITILALAFAGFYYYTGEEQKRLRQAVDEQRDDALRKQSLFLANLSKQRVEAGEKEQGILLALEALPGNPTAPDRPYVIEAERALYRAVMARDPPQKIAEVVMRGIGYTVFSPNGSRLIAMPFFGGNKARLLDAQDGKEIARFASANYAHFSHDSKRFVTHYNQTIVIRDANTGDKISVIPEHQGHLQVAKISADGQLILSVSRDDTARLRDAETGDQVAIFQVERDQKLWHADISPDKTRVAVLSTNRGSGRVHLWDVATGKSVMIIDGFRGGGNSNPNTYAGPLFSPDGRYLIAAMADNTVGIWDAADGSSKGVLRGHGHRIKHVEFSSDGRQIVTASADGTARIWDTQTLTTVTVLHAKAPGNARRYNLFGLWTGFHHASFSPDGNHVVTVGVDGVRVWRIDDGAERAVLYGEKGGCPGQNCWYASFSRDGRRLVGIVGNTVTLWQLGIGDSDAIYTAGDGKIVDMAFSPDSRQILVGSDNGIARLLKTENGELLKIMRGHKGPLMRAIFSPAGGRIVTASEDGAAIVWDTAGVQVARRLQGHEDAVLDAQFSPDGSRILTTSKDASARIWDTDGKSLAVFRGHADAVWYGSFSPDGKSVATVSADGTTRVWDAATGEQSKIFQDSASDFGPVGPAFRPAFSPHEHSLVTPRGPKHASDGYYVTVTAGVSIEDAQQSFFGAYLWDLHTGTRLSVFDGYLRGYAGTVLQVVFSPNGKHIVAAGHSGSRLWDHAELRKGAAVEPLAYLSNCFGVFFASFNRGGSRFLDVTSEGNIDIFDGNGAYLITLYSFESSRTPGRCTPVRKATAAALSPDGRYVVVAGLDGKLRLFRIYLSTQALIDRGRTLVTGELTAAERRRFFLSASSDTKPAKKAPEKSRPKNPVEQK
ncbi:MAG: AAA family ATPase [Pseudomonadota bacterium]